MIKAVRFTLVVLFLVTMSAGICAAQTPEDEIKEALATLIKLLEEDKLKEFVEFSTPPEILEKATPEQLKEFMALFEKDKARILAMLKETQGYEMNFN